MALSFCAISPAAFATEGALGRSITGLQVQSYAGLVPPTPGWSFNSSYAYYQGSIGGDLETPLTGGGSTFGLSATLQLMSFTGIYIWDTGDGPWNFASAVTVPFARVEADAFLRFGEVNLRASDRDTGLFDVTLVPVIASRHLGPVHHVSLGLYLFAPTGSYEAGRLANAGLNTWTFSPTFAYTQLARQGSLELTVAVAADVYSRNSATDYRNGAVFRTEALVLQRLPNGWGLGVGAGWIQQVQDDTGPGADRLDGFRGRSFAVGPAATYAHKWEGGQIEFSARWLHEFGVRRRLEGSPFLVSATYSF